MAKYKYIIWDWNGTLLDDLMLNYEVVNTLLERRGLPLLESVEYYHSIFSFPIIDFYTVMGFDFNKESFHDVAKEYTFMIDERFPELTVFPDAENILWYFKHKGINQLIISQLEHTTLQKQVRAHEIDYLFTEILGTGDIYAKSKVGVALNWLSRSGAKGEEILFIGDTVHDFEVAESIGCECVLISRGHNSFDMLKATGCTVLHSIDELKALVD